MEAIILKTEKDNIFSADSACEHSLSVGQSVYYKGCCYDSLIDLKRALAYDWDVDILSEPIIDTTVSSKVSLFGQRAQIPTRVSDPIKVKFIVSATPWASSDREIGLKLVIENVMPTMRACGLKRFERLPRSVPHLISTSTSRAFETQVLLPNNSFVVWRGIPIEESLTKRLGGVIILGDAEKRHSRLPNQVLTLIIRSTLVECYSLPSLDDHLEE